MSPSSAHGAQVFELIDLSVTPVMAPYWDRTTSPAARTVDGERNEHTTNPRVEEVVSELTPVTLETDLTAIAAQGPFDPCDTDAGTYVDPRAPDKRRVAVREQPLPLAAQSQPVSKPPGSQSSDPPTALVRRNDGHIELPPGSVVDDYEIDHRLGAGAMGEVYAARHVKLGKRVAIKAISPRLSEDAAAIERFEQEARTVAQMHHPGLVDVLGFGELPDGRAYFVMEYLAGESLFDRLARGRLTADEALDIFDQMARALEAAHRHSVIHRDLKPENTFLARITNEHRPIVKLLDFGLAKLAVDADRRAERTQSGAVIGTAKYLSPEQARGPNVDHRTDIYALGCIGYEVFLGRSPFEDARTMGALIAAHVHETPPMPRSISPGIPPELDLLLFAMLAKDPAYRPTLTQVRAVIAGVRSPMPIAATPARAFSHGDATRMTAPVAPRSSNTTTFLIAGAAMIAGLVIGAAGHCGGSRSIADKPAAPSGVRSPAKHETDVAPATMPSPFEDKRDVAPRATPSSVTDAGISVVAPRSTDAGAVRSHRASGLAVDAGSVSTAPIESKSPTAGASSVEPEPYPLEAFESLAIDAGVTTPETIDFDTAVRPPPTSRPVQRPSPPPPRPPPPPPAKKKPSSPWPPGYDTDRDQTVNPFEKRRR